LVSIAIFQTMIHLADLCIYMSSKSVSFLQDGSQKSNHNCLIIGYTIFCLASIAILHQIYNSL
jgi:hypothetical protein